MLFSQCFHQWIHLEVKFIVKRHTTRKNWCFCRRPMKFLNIASENNVLRGKTQLQWRNKTSRKATGRFTMQDHSPVHKSDAWRDQIHGSKSVPRHASGERGALLGAERSLPQGLPQTSCGCRRAGGSPAGGRSRRHGCISLPWEPEAKSVRYEHPSLATTLPWPLSVTTSHLIRIW